MGAVFGAALAARLPPHDIETIFGLVLLVTVYLMLRLKEPTPVNHVEGFATQSRERAEPRAGPSSRVQASRVARLAHLEASTATKAR